MMSDCDQDLEPKIKPDHERFESEEEKGGPIFVPPLYMQRYFYVQQELQKHGSKSVIDFGSAECKISRFLVQVPSLEKIALIDIDGPLLESNKYLIKPQLCDYLKNREKSLTVQIYEGSVTQLDEKIMDIEAVSMVEIIEHLYPDILEAACDMIFRGLQPKLIIMTTPNADYNVLFPNFIGFRHWDHKFEWSRKEFQDWANNLTDKYPYSVTFSGVGEPPADSAHLGFCSQSAVFTRCSSHNENNKSSFPLTNTYRLIAESIYPHKQTKETSEIDSLLHEVNYLIRQMSTYDHSDGNYQENVKYLTCEENAKGVTCGEYVKENVKDLKCEENVKENVTDSKFEENVEASNCEKSFNDSGSKYDRIETVFNNSEDGKRCQCPEYDEKRNQTKWEDEAEEWEENVKCFVPLTYFLKFDKFKKGFDTDRFRTFLQNHGYRISKDGQSVIVYEEYSSDSDDDIDDSGLFDHVDREEPAVLCDSGIHIQDQSQQECEDWG